MAATAPSRAGSTEGAHVAALDGLRGIAALIVVGRHCVNAIPMPAPWRRALYESPLALVLNSQGAVQLFFVLSGWVLAASLARSGERAPWLSFYVRRVFRIHPPYVAAVLFAWALSSVWGIPEAARVTPWLARSVIHPSASQVVASLWFPGVGAGLISVGWTLRIEMIYSLALPLLVLAARPGRGLLLLAGGVALLAVPLQTAKYALDFTLGVAAFQQRAAIGAAVARLPRSARALLPALGALLFAAPLAFGSKREGGILVSGFAPSQIAVMGLGSAVLVIAATTLPRFSAWLSRAPVLFLGRLSYSLYLLHLPLITWLAPLLLVPSVVATELGPRPAVTLASGLGLIGAVVLGSVLLAVPFYRFVELPSMALGRRIANRLGALRQASWSWSR